MAKKQDIETGALNPSKVELNSERRESDSDRREARSDRRSSRAHLAKAPRRKVADRRQDGPGLDVQADKINTVSPSNP
ncbi:MAG: hypothetical protein KUG79_05330 [Pseudomonadales bacterium]|nr:hypothetical protein [Pseudomonadales bacterium]